MEGIISNLLQNIFFSFFFIILVRHYDKTNLGYYIIGNFLYATLSSIAALGIGNSYVRNYKNASDKKKVLSEFLQLMTISSICFMLINVFTSHILYNQNEIHVLSYILGLHIFIDNVFYAVRYHQFGTDRQKIAYRLLVADSIIKLVVAGLLLFFDITIIKLLVFVSFFRILVLIFTWRYYMNPHNFLDTLLSEKMNLFKLVKLIKTEHTFIIISFLAILNWRTGSFYISKYFSIEDVTEYEIAFKLFSITYMVPVVVSNALYPRFVSLQKDMHSLYKLYRGSFIFLLLFGTGTYTFMHAFAEQIIHFLFGTNHINAVEYAKDIFLIMLPYPIIQLQASYLVAGGGEVYDLWGNLLVCCTTIILGYIFLRYYHEVTAVIYSLFLSFIVFIVFQEVVLNKYRKSFALSNLLLYGITAIGIFCFHLLVKATNHSIAFPLFWSVTIIGVLTWMFLCKKSYSDIFSSF